MKKAYFYLFFVIYSVIKKTPNKDIAEWVAVILIALLLIFNIFCIIYLTDINDFIIQNLKFNMKLFYLFLFFIILYMNVILFLKGERYKAIVNKFSLMHFKIKFIMSFAVLLYIVCTIFVLILAIELK